MRTLFIAGFGEDDFIFDHIHGCLPGEKRFLNLWSLLPNHPIADLNVAEFAQELVQRFAITEQDLIIGHSTGGWVALHIKQATNCCLVQLASWTDSRKVVTPVANRQLIYWVARSGLYLNRFILGQLVKRYYWNKPSREVFTRVFERLISGKRANAVNHLRLILNPYPYVISVSPDLRIHAKADRIVRFPDEPVHEVPGDHFSLYTNPEAVCSVIEHYMKGEYLPKQDLNRL